MAEATPQMDLYNACRSGEHYAAEAALDAGADPSTPPTPRHRAPLLEACHHGHLAIVELLLSRGAELVQDGPFPTPAIHQAILKRHPAIIALLMDHGAWKHETRDYRHPLWNAFSWGNHEAFAIVLRRLPNLAETLARPLGEVINGRICAQPESVRLLLDSGFDPMTRDKQGCTLLHEISPRSDFYAKEGRLTQACVKSIVYLLDAGLDPDAKDRAGARAEIRESAEHWAAVEGRLRARPAKAAPRKAVTEDWQPLLEAAARGGDIGAARALVAAGHDLGQPLRKSRTTALQLACRFDQSEFLAFMIQLGLNPNLPDRKMRTPLHEAAKFHSDSCVAVLIDAGAQIDVESSDGNTPLLEVDLSKPAALSTLEKLLAAGADPTRSKGQSRSGGIDSGRAHLLFEAVRYLRADVVRLVLDRGVSAGIVDALGSTLGHVLLTRTQTAASVRKILPLLVEKGLDLNRPGILPFHRWTVQDQLVTLKLQDCLYTKPG